MTMRLRAVLVPRLASLVLAAASAGFVAFALELPRGTHTRPGAGYVPLLAGLIGFALALVAAAFDRDAPAPADAPGGLAIAAALLAFCVLLPVLGFVVAGTLLVALLSWMLGATRPVQWLAVAIPTPIALQWLFATLFQLTLPPGRLW